MGLIYALVCEARAYPEGMDLQTNALTNTQVFSVKVKDLAGLPWMAAARWCMHTIYRVKRKFFFFFNRRAPLTFKTHFKCLLNVRRILNETKKTITFKHKNWRLIFQVKLQLVLVYVPFVRNANLRQKIRFYFFFADFLDDGCLHFWPTPSISKVPNEVARLFSLKDAKSRKSVILEVVKKEEDNSTKIGRVINNKIQSERD